MERSRAGIPTEADVRGLERRSKGFPSAGRLGYRREDVDAFVGRAITALRAAIARNETLRTGSTPASGWWPDAGDEDLDIEGAVFATARFRHGYDMRSVDELLDEIADHLQRLAAERRAPGTTRRRGRPGMVTVDDVREVARDLPRASEVLVRDRVKFRVGRIVFLAFSRDETTMGFAFPKEERDALVASEPRKFEMPTASDLRYHWVVVRLAAIDRTEMREIVVDAWRFVVPKKVAAAYDAGRSVT